MRLFVSALDFCDHLNSGAATADTSELACCRVKRGCVTIFTVAAVAVPSVTKKLVVGRHPIQNSVMNFDKMSRRRWKKGRLTSAADEDEG